MEFKDKVIWITGASSGIGEALVYEFIKRDARVIMSARRKAELERVQNNSTRPENCHVCPFDVTNANEIEKVSTEVFKKFRNIDILINNSGISQRSLIAETPVEIDRKIMEVNYFGAVTLTKKILPEMLRQKSGHIVAISSVVGKFGYPMRSAYSASKHALHGFFETLYAENRPKNIFVTIVFPGRIRTDISRNAITKTGAPHGIMDPGQEKGMDPEACAKKIVKAISKRKFELFVGGQEGLMLFFRKYIPSLFFRIAKKISPT